jgi:hemin uptake protein HemP
MISDGDLVSTDSKQELVSTPPSPHGAGPGVREVDVQSLLGAAREVVLAHRGARYRLRITAAGKLILTK